VNMREFQYVVPGSLPEALSLAEQYALEGAMLAGGTDLVVQLKRGDRSPSFVVNLKRIPSLSDITYTRDAGVYIGTLATHNDLAEHPKIVGDFALLAEAAASVGTFQVRERGTIGGNICNGSPAADTVPPLICLGANLKLESATRGERLVPVEEFFEAPQVTNRAPDEILTQIQIPNVAPRTGGAYLKLGKRKALEIAVVGVAVLITLDDKGATCLTAKLGLASVAPTPIRARKAETILIGQKLEERIINEAALAAQKEASPISDLRSSAEYRREMVNVLTKRALNIAFERAKNPSMQ